MNHWKKVLPNYVYDISYEELIKNQKEQTQKLLNFCSLSWDEKCIEFHKSSRPITTASLVQARKPIYQDSLKSWEKFKDQLKPLLQVLSN